MGEVTMTQLSYGEYMKTGLKIDRLQQESRQIEDIISRLNSNGAHMVSGLKYDATVLTFRLSRLQKEIDELNELMDENR